VSGALVKFYRIFNTTGDFTYIGGFVTDGNGQGSIDLFPFQLYMIKTSYSGYENKTDWWTPNIVEQSIIKIFKLTLSLSTNESIIQPARNPGFYVFFEDLSSRTNSTLYLHYHDTLDGTIDVHVYVYEHNVTTGNITLFYSNEGITSSEFYLNLTGLRSNNSYSINLFYNHTEFGSQSLTTYFEGWHTTLTTPYHLNLILTSIFKSGAMALSHFMMFLLLLAMFYWIDKEHVGIGLIIIGGLFLCINIYIGLDDALSTAASGIIPTLLMVVGGMKEAITRGLIG
jgi:hypothetical protein